MGRWVRTLHTRGEQILTRAVGYLKTYRLQWGQPDRRALLPSALEGLTAPSETEPVQESPAPEPENAPPYFTADTPPELISVIMNDWPYSGAYITSSLKLKLNSSV